MDSTSLLDLPGESFSHELQENARLSIAELGRRIGLSPTATAERLKQMEETGILCAATLSRSTAKPSASKCSPSSA